ncbi:MAG: SpoIIE family protein phosphatase [Marinisporobacter sp.]|nr:SpoIIE family protein phosphatase [Marinisporobacter sp.]
MDEIMRNIDLGMTFRALLGDESECGDIGVIQEYDHQCFLALIDVLGHGSEARKIALSAKKYLKNNYRMDLTDMINGLHEHLKGTRGAVAAVCHLDILTGELTYVGIGNITVRIFGTKPTRLIPKDGTIGYRMRKPQKHRMKLYPGDTILMHSDGIKEHFDLINYVGLLRENAGSIAARILEYFWKKNDDASCIVLKYSM